MWVVCAWLLWLVAKPHLYKGYSSLVCGEGCHKAYWLVSPRGSEAKSSPLMVDSISDWAFVGIGVHDLVPACHNWMQDVGCPKAGYSFLVGLDLRVIAWGPHGMPEFVLACTKKDQAPRGGLDGAHLMVGGLYPGGYCWLYGEWSQVTGLWVARSRSPRTDVNSLVGGAGIPGYLEAGAQWFMRPDPRTNASSLVGRAGSKDLQLFELRVSLGLLLVH